MTATYGAEWSPRCHGIERYLAQKFSGAHVVAQELDMVPRFAVTAADIPGFPAASRGKGRPTGWFDWYDWALVYRYWTGEADGLRRPYLLEIAELLRLGAHLDNVALATRLGFSVRQVIRWRKALTS